MNIGSWIVIACLVATPVFADATSEAKAHSEAFERAMNAGDVKAILALYSDDAHVIWPGQGDEATGKPEIEKLIVGTLKAFPDAKSTLKSQKVVPLGSGYTGIIGSWELSYKDADGKTKTMQLRTTEVIKKQGKHTVYVIDHASVGVPPPPAEGAAGQGAPPQ
jgi:ketosteroid isomerase-like protein